MRPPEPLGATPARKLLVTVDQVVVIVRPPRFPSSDNMYFYHEYTPCFFEDHLCVVLHDHYAEMWQYHAETAARFRTTCAVLISSPVHFGMFWVLLSVRRPCLTFPSGVGNPTWCSDG